MKAAVLDGLESKNRLANALKDIIKNRCQKFSDFILRDMKIHPCRSCGVCGYKTPGKCVISDDMPNVLRGFATSNILVFLTPVRFGGYSSKLKKAVDRLMIVGTPLYEVKKGHLLHPMRYGDKALIVIGFLEESLKGQEEAITNLVKNNALNMQFSYNKTLIFEETDSFATIEKEISKVFDEVNKG